MHPDEVDVSADLVRRLLETQFPDWAHLPLSPFEHGGTDHVIVRLGDELQVRLPKHEPSTGQVEKELELLPRLGPQLPVEIPRPLARGEPGEGYPFTWAVYRWLPGEPPREASVQLARELAEFIRALQRVDTAGAPPPRHRGAPLRDDAFIRSSIAHLAPDFDADAVTHEWERVLALPQWDRAPVWLHGDLLASNVLVRGGRLVAVLDWGATCAGDPAADYMISWSLLAPVREAFRAALDVDDATWARGRGWALWQAVAALPYYRHTNPPMVAHARSAIAGVLADTDG
jgi:aminoglycoside phosphotransferase (APT) family kinase protein